MAEDLSGKVALVTGASSGIGRALVRTLAAAGCDLVLVAQSPDRLAAIGAEAEAAGRKVLTLPADLTKPEAVDAVAAAALDAFGRVDLLLANAGLYLPGDVADGDPDAFDRLLNLNVNSVFRLVNRLLPTMVEQKGGHVLITSSVSGHQAIQWEPVYSASKHAIQSFVHGLRRQVARHGIRVGAVAPGVVLNELWGYRDEADIAAKVATREGLRSEDVADAVLFMLTRPAHVTIRDLVILPQNQDI